MTNASARYLKTVVLLCVVALIATHALAQSPTPSVAPDSLQAFLGRTIAAINIQGQSTLPANKALAIVKLKSGDILTSSALADCIQTLYNTGFYRDIGVEAADAGNGRVALTFVTSENYFVGTIWITGAPKAPPTTVQLVNSTKLQLGELVTPEKIQSAIAGIQQSLQSNGYHQAQVSVLQGPDSTRQQMELTFVVKPGALARVGTMTVTGNPGYASQQVEDIAKLHPGDRTGIQRVRAALGRLRSKYQKKGRLEAQVTVQKRQYIPASNRENFALNINQGPKIKVLVEGARLRQGLIKRYVPIFQENAVDADLLNEGARNLRDYFQTKGFFDVRVTYREQYQAADKNTHVIFDVSKGQRHKLLAIVLQGNHYFSSDDLREHMTIEASSFLLRHGRFSQSLLADDIQSIKNLYQANGFQQIEVRSQTQDDYGGIKGHMRVVLNIKEGAQTLVSNLKITGNDSVPASTLLALPLDETSGQPFSDQTIANDRLAVLNYYLQLGFPNAQFTVSVKPASSNPPRMAVTYNLSEGQRVYVNQVFISGLHFTRPYVVKREMGVDPGDPLSADAMVATQQNLYNLDLFNQVDTAIQNPDGVSPQKNVLFQLEEAKRYTFDYGIGLEAQTGNIPSNVTTVNGKPVASPLGRTGVSPRVSFDVSRINFRGRDQTLSFRSRYGRLQQEALVSFENPHFFNDPKLRFVLTSFYDITRDVLTFTAERVEGSAQIEQRVSRPTTLIYGFTYRRVKVDPRTLAIDPNLIPLLSKPVRVGMPTFTYIRDKRDNPLDSRTGNYNTFDTGVSTGFFGSEASFSRFLYTNSSYQQFHKKKWVFARDTKIGVENNLGSSTFIPLPERFYAGGANSLRSFAINQAGPRDIVTGFPVGGEALLLNQLEVRFSPLPLPLIGTNLSPVLFHDAGNVFSHADEMLPSIFRFRPTKCDTTNGSSTCDFNYFSHAVGAGLRYSTPIGPVRVDVGYNLNPPTFPVLNDPLKPLQTLGRFNFFFSIGQSF